MAAVPAPAIAPVDQHAALPREACAEPAARAEAPCGGQQKGATTAAVVTAWAECAALVRSGRRLSRGLYSALWAATTASAAELTAADVAALMEAWAQLLAIRPQLFSAASAELDVLLSIAFPAAVKRMDAAQLGRLAKLCAIVVRPLLADYAGLVDWSTGALPAMRQVFALVEAEVAWRAEECWSSVPAATVAAVLAAQALLVGGTLGRDLRGSLTNSIVLEVCLRRALSSLKVSSWLHTCPTTFD